MQLGFVQRFPPFQRASLADRAPDPFFFTVALLLPLLSLISYSLIMQLTNKALPYTGAFPHYCSLIYNLISDCRGQIVYYLGSFFASVVYGQCIINV